MKRLSIIFLLFIFLSCEFDTHYLYEPQPINIASKDIFSINGIVYNSTAKYLPFTIYNPNNYTIIITVDGTEYTIQNYEHLEIEDSI